MTVLTALLGLVIGAVVGGLGGGGGVLTVPALVYLLGESAQDATTASVVVVGITAVAGVVARTRTREVDWPTSLAFGVVGIPAAWLGTILNDRVGQPVLLLAFAGLTLVAAAAMLIHAHGPRDASGQAGEEPLPDDDRSRNVADGHPTASRAAAARVSSQRAIVTSRRRGAGVAPVLATAAKVALGATAVGFLTGFLGVGGGFLVVPVLVIMLRMPMGSAIGTSLLIIALNSASSMVSRIGVMHLDWRIIVPFAVAAVAGTLAGKRVADRFSGRTLGITFAWLLVAVGLFVGAQNLPAL